MNTPNTSYLDIEASCTNNPFQLEIYGTSDRYYITNDILFVRIQIVSYTVHAVCSFDTEETNHYYSQFVFSCISLDESVPRESHEIRPTNNKIIEL